MVFDVNSLTTEEVLATRIILEKLPCTHENLACADCPCFEICKFLHKIMEQCNDVLELEVRSFS